MAGTVHAATMPLDMARVGPVHGSDILSDLVARDGLGYECVPEELLDAAFQLSDKGLAMPQTCLPDPCKEALSRDRYASLLGHAPTAREWDDYYARYGEVCRAEVTPFGDDAGDTVLAGLPNDTAGFWAPLLPVGRSISTPLAGRTSGGGRLGGGFPGGGFLGGGTSFDGDDDGTEVSQVITDGSSFDDPGRGSSSDPERLPQPYPGPDGPDKLDDPFSDPRSPPRTTENTPAPPAVPLPAPAWALLSAFAALAALRARKRTG
ncbi:hypothetical protein R5H30_00090 [Sulfitobacter sp. D35]|uniref:hypothetical protein n=1 Tax=Sulfitobacter sp. D35 TaxID=3083252 RepID=UPI00296EA240|nr:hypothetical protein [Sulfitobacter sp. D35]MDW4496364.1 hypothetical protein [Sulfitobacter sp. D35]